MLVLMDEPLFEVVDNRRVAVAPMGAHESLLATRLATFLTGFAKPRHLGQAAIEVLYDLAPIKRERRLGVSFVASTRWPYNRLPPRGENAFKVIPNLAAEVVSPSNTADEIMVKVHEYFQAGVELVWVIYPPTCEVYVYESPQSIRVLTRQDSLDGGQVLPGFQLALAELFEDVTTTDEGK